MGAVEFDFELLVDLAELVYFLFQQADAFFLYVEIFEVFAVDLIDQSLLLSLAVDSLKLLLYFYQFTLFLILLIAQFLHFLAFLRYFLNHIFVVLDELLVLDFEVLGNLLHL
jgi:hypothetical protein